MGNLNEEEGTANPKLELVCFKLVFLYYWKSIISDMALIE
jgi:hypothetical protein